jgi:hypothetical protein
MKVFRYNLNPNGEGPAGRLPAGSLTGYYSEPYYYGAAMIDNFDGLEGFNPEEITTVEFNNAVKNISPDGSNTTPALVAFQNTVRDFYAQKMKDLVTPYTLEERETWFIQLKEAQDWTANNFSPTPMLTAIANARSSNVASMVEGVITKNTLYTTAVGTVLGEQQAVIESLWTE